MSTPAPGWYPDPHAGGVRWWDGRGWTDHRGPALVTVVAQPPLPAGRTTATPWAYLQAVVPVAQVLALLPYLLAFGSLFAAQSALYGGSDGSTPAPAQTREVVSGFAQVLGAFAVTSGLVLLLMAAWVVLAVLDARRLERIGIVQPFSWAWSFLGLVYPIGRAVVLHRRVRQGLGPIWVLIGAIVAQFVLTVVLEAVVLLPAFAGLAALPSAPASACGC